MESGKKISFGFNKSNKKPAVIVNKPVEHDKIELVDCLEEQSIKIKDAVEVIHKPLVIPIKDNKKNLLDRVKEAKSTQKQLVKDKPKQEDDIRPDSELTIEELAARELIKDAKNHRSNKVPNKILVLPAKDDKLILDGESEPTLDDYESVPVTDYGMAMLRGMGWKEGMGIGRNPTKSALTSEPELRPKGLGLGASRMVKAEISNEVARDNDGNELILKRGTFAKIIAGSHKGSYCEVQGLDEEAGRVIVRTSLKGEILTLNEFLIVPVTKEEYSKGSRVLNNAKYEEYKEMSDKKLEDHRKKKEGSTDRYKEEVVESNGSSRHLNENKSSKDDAEKATRSSDYYREEYLTSKEVTRKHNKNREYEKIDKYSKDTNKEYESRSRYSHRDRKKSSSDSDSGNEKKNRKDNDRKKHYHRESSRSHEDRYKSDKKSSKSRHRSRSPSSNDDERQGNRRNKKSSHRKNESSEREKTSRKTRR